MSGPHYPLTVRAGLRERLWTVIGCVAFLVPAIWMCVVAVTQVNDLWTTICGLVLFGGFGAGAVWFGGYAWTFKTIFDPIGVTTETMWGVRRFDRAHLHGWRWGAVGSEIVTVELYKEDSPKPFQVLVPKANDLTIAAWFEGTQDLESAEVNQSITEIEVDANLGATREERIKSADAETLLLKRAYWFFLALTIWVWVFPRPYYLALGIAIAAPVLILLVTYLRRDRLRLWPGANKFRAQRENWWFFASAPRSFAP
ncbi:MAG: hypothetical protein NT015_16165 [Alphaproteobacteria bacterium]|nr:hypothetical protein [Alphaproteobacteria bacterium]